MKNFILVLSKEILTSSSTMKISIPQCYVEIH